MRRSLILPGLVACGLALAACQPATTETETEPDQSALETPPADILPEEEPVPDAARAGAPAGEGELMEDPPMPADPDNPMGATPPTLPEGQVSPPAQ